MLGISRDTVGKYVRQLRKQEQNQPNLTVGKPGPETPNSGVSEDSTRSKPATNPTLGSSGPDSLSKPYHEVIAGKVQEGLSAQRIYQDLVAEHGFEGSYQSVKRYVRRHFGGSELPFRRMECDPGEEAQVDFGKGALVREPGKKARRPWLFRIVLSNSRKAYSEVVWKQTTENFIRCLENAFLAWGGVPKTLVLDNLKAAVSEADWYDPELNPKIADFARHYGTVILPTKSYTPRP